MTNLEFKSNLTKQLCIRLVLPAQEAVAGQTISVALGQHGVKTNEFIKQFNELSKKFIKGLFISILVFVFFDGSFIIEIKGINIPLLLKQFINEETQSIFFKDLILLSIILKNNRNLFFNQHSYLSIIKSLKGSLLSRNIKIIF